MLAEAEIQERRKRLGPFGGWIVAEMLIGLIACDPQGVLADGRLFLRTIEPAAGFVDPERFLFADVINDALE